MFGRRHDCIWKFAFAIDFESSCALKMSLSGTWESSTGVAVNFFSWNALKRSEWFCRPEFLVEEEKSGLVSNNWRTLHSKGPIFVTSQLLRKDQRYCCLDWDTQTTPFEKDLSSFCDRLVEAREGSLLLKLGRVWNSWTSAVVARSRLSQRLDFPETEWQPIDCFWSAVSFPRSSSAEKPLGLHVNLPKWLNWRCSLILQWTSLPL